MNLFQWLTLPIIALMLLHDLRGSLFRRPYFRRDRVVRCCVWSLAGLAIIDPGLTSVLAEEIGIHRGTDLVLYLFSLAFLATSFYFYSQSVRAERRMTELVRYIAIRDARHADHP